MGFFDRFRRSSKPEAEEPPARREDPIRIAQGANKTKTGSGGGDSQPDQELLDAIAAIWDGKEPVISSTTESPISSGSSSEQEVDLAKTLSLLMGEKPEPEEGDSESTYEEEVNDAIDAVVGMMREMPGAAELQERIRQYAESTQGQEDEPESMPEPETRVESSGEPADDLLASIAALMGQDAPEPEPAAQPPSEPEPKAEPAGDSAEDLLASISALIGQDPLEPEPEPAAQPSSEPVPSPDENPFSAIAELMGQGSSEPEPTDELATGKSDGDGEDLLASIAALMGGSMYASDQHETEVPAKPAIPEIDPDLAETFTSLCAESERFQDEGALETALAKYLQASVLCEKSAALKGMALHHAAAFTMYQVGDGFSAASFVREGLECGDEFRAYAQEHQTEGQPNAYLESLQIAALTATSYDEALEFADRGVELYGDDFGTLADELRQYRAEHPRFADWQRSESLKHYSRVSAEEDKGDYAPAMALMDIILRNAKEDAYGLSYEEQAQILDDYGTISIMHMLGKARSLGLSQDDFGYELSFIADGALFRLADFMPDCKPAEKQNLERIIQGMKMLPGVSGRIAFEPFK